MRGHNHDRILAGSALALALALASPVFGQEVKAPMSPAAIEAAVPVPEPANVPPPTAADVAGPRMTVGSQSSDAVPADSPATTAPAAPAPTPAAAPADQPAPAAAPAPQVVEDPLAVKLRDLLTTRGDRYFSRRNERVAAEAFYRERNFAPLWVENGKTNARGDTAIAFLQRVDTDGLEPADYPIPNFKAGETDALADAELKFTAEILEYARHAQLGRAHYSRISNDIGFEQEAPEPGEILGKMAGATDVRAALDSYNPQHPQYKALKAKLAEARKQAGEPEVEIVRIPDGAKVKPGAEDPRVPLLRKRLKIEGDQDDARYDDSVIAAVKKFQQGAGLNVDGMIGPATLRALNATPKRARVVDTIIVNMDRWRWYPRDLGKVYVMVNIPDYSLRIVREQKLFWNTRIVVGKPTQATPLTTAQMKFITVNPTWNVPPSIIANEYLPAVRQDPGVLERMGLRMEQNRDGTVRIYQPPGERNALGRIRFNFPNKFLVYQHDTPDKHLFAHDKRAYSHGCMRVQDPLLYGEKLLSIMLPQEKYTQEKLRGMFGGSEININFPNNLPVHLTYQTAFVDEAGTLQVRDDIYGRDAAHIAATKGEARKVADIATPRSPTGSGITQDSLRYQMREASPFADWFSSRQADRNGRPGSRVSGRQEPFGGFFARFFR